MKTCSRDAVSLWITEEIDDRAVVLHAEKRTVRKKLKKSLKYKRQKTLITITVIARTINE